ncbi:uncharacterized protein LOC142310762 [Anomaloglossus baeobatrachus]|uniref:uncharacterized protein LOC142310762 n=1 Tax=Anomaloglossus baeobatrachus TaxID=238106 RepID=UPI003F50ACEF
MERYLLRSAGGGEGTCRSGDAVGRSGVEENSMVPESMMEEEPETRAGDAAKLCRRQREEDEVVSGETEESETGEKCQQGTEEDGQQWEEEGDMEEEERREEESSNEGTGGLGENMEPQHRGNGLGQSQQKISTGFITPNKRCKKHPGTVVSQNYKQLEGGRGSVQVRRTRKTAPPAGQHKQPQEFNVDYKKLADEVASHLSKEIKTAIETAIQTSLAAMQKEINDQATRLIETEQRISESEEAILTMQEQIATLMKSNDYLRDKAEDLENRSRRNNLRIVGLPESVSMGQLDNICELELPQALGIKAKFRVERAHRVGPLRQKEANKAEGQNSNKFSPRARQVIVKYLDYKHKEEILKAFRDRKRPLQYQGNRLLIFGDYSADVSKRRKEFSKICTFLYNKKIKCQLLYPAILKVRNPNGSFAYYKDYKEAENILMSEQDKSRMERQERGPSGGDTGGRGSPTGPGRDAGQSKGRTSEEVRGDRCRSPAQRHSPRTGHGD